MAGPRRRPAETRIPTTEQEFRERAARAFDNSVNSIIRTQFSQRPSPSEMRLLSGVVERLGARELDDSVMQEFRREWNRAHPDGPRSVIDRYYGITGSTTWLLTPTGTIGFNQSALAVDVRAYFSNAREAVASSLGQLAIAPQNQRYRHISLEFARIDRDLMALVQQQLAQQFQSGQNQLPVAVTYCATSAQVPSELRNIALQAPLILFERQRQA